MAGKARSQSAMEYLMTYGWAILAIAIVMVSLYSLGIFNTGSLQPTATPGSCEVVRSAAQTSLAGQCSNLIPKYVAQFYVGNYVDAGKSGDLGTTGSISVSAWVKLSSTASSEMGFVTRYGSGYSWALRTSGSSGIAEFTVDYPSGTDYNSQSGIVLSPGTWYLLSGVYDSSQQKVYIYVNGVQKASLSGPAAIASTGNPLIIGGDNRPSYYANSSVANVQVYNTSLDSTSIATLYEEGIGGAPIDLQHLVGWWPLNGNTNDYSGNNYQGTGSSGIIWNANWQSGYSAPAS